jgi:hypothetical protein
LRRPPLKHAWLAQAALKLLMQRHSMLPLRYCVPTSMTYRHQRGGKAQKLRAVHQL